MAEHLIAMSSWSRERKIGLFALANLVLLVVLYCAKGMMACLGGCLWSCLGWLLYAIRPKSVLHQTSVQSIGIKERAIIGMACLATVLVCTVPMSLSPVWNGDIENHHIQYELLADSLLHGKLTICDDKDTSALMALENPYDPIQREGVDCQKDHAFYQGKYYVYFGVVPAIVVFIPYQLITGHPLLEYRATQLFTAMFIVGLFLLFLKLLRVFYPSVPVSVYTLLSVVSSIICCLCAVIGPSLYCTAITAALAFEIWSLYLFLHAVYCLKGQKWQIPIATLGALCGALVFGCRPPLGLMNVLVIPMLVRFLRDRGLSLRTWACVLCVALPYCVVAAGLMYYNYARFGSPFDFGAAYQLTWHDIASYHEYAKSMGIPYYLTMLRKNFIGFGEPITKFPYTKWGGVICNYPVFLGCLLVIQRNYQQGFRQKGLAMFVALLVALPVLETVLCAQWSPDSLERYRMDVYPSLVLLLLLVVAQSFSFMDEADGSKHASAICLVLVLTLCKCALLFCVPYDSNWTEYDPEALGYIKSVLSLGHLLR